MTDEARLAMRGLIDIVLGGWLINRFFWHTTQMPASRARWVQLTIISLLLFLLKWLGVWSWQEIGAAINLTPVIWPIVFLLLYLLYRNYKLSTSLEKAEFEIDWRREYQEVLMEELEQKGRPIPPANRD